jgi:hypothetical protein
MQQFEFRFFDKSDASAMVRVYTAQDDLTALNEAERLFESYTVEVWQGDRRVARVKKRKMRHFKPKIGSPYDFHSHC